MITLASTSPRRREIMSFFSLPFKCVSPDFDEEAVPYEGNPMAHGIVLSEGKAMSIKPESKDSIIIAADTIVALGNKCYAKPSSHEEAQAFLADLVDKWHSVFTAVTIVKNGEVYSKAEETRVLFNPLTPEEIKLYCDKIHWADKAGGYAIQMGGGLIVKKIDGCYYNVLGLPINTLHELLKHFNIELWEYVI